MSSENDLGQIFNDEVRESKINVQNVPGAKHTIQPKTIYIILKLMEK